MFDFHRDYNKEIREVIMRAIDSCTPAHTAELKRQIKRNLRNYLMKKTRQSPMIVPVVVEI